jgi:hypothetical protein
MFNPIFVDQSDDRSGFDGAVSQSAGFNDSRQTKRGQGNESAYAHALKSSARNLSSEDPAQAHDDGDEQNLSWSKSKRLCAASSERVASGTGGLHLLNPLCTGGLLTPAMSGAGPGRAVMGYGDPDHARYSIPDQSLRSPPHIAPYSEAREPAIFHRLPSRSPLLKWQRPPRAAPSQARLLGARRQGRVIPPAAAARRGGRGGRWDGPRRR